jgi:hypothetical protein
VFSSAWIFFLFNVFWKVSCYAIINLTLSQKTPNLDWESLLLRMTYLKLRKIFCRKKKNILFRKFFTKKCIEANFMNAQCFSSCCCLKKKFNWSLRKLMGLDHYKCIMPLFWIKQTNEKHWSLNTQDGLSGYRKKKFGL